MTRFQRTSTDIPTDHTHLKVLLIEQSKLSLAVLTRLFHSLGFESTVASDIETAKQLLTNEEFKLVCMSRYLNGTDAFKLVPDIRQQGCKTPLLLLTANHKKSTRVNALKAGITEVIPKDSISEMSEQIRAFVRSSVPTNLQRGRILYVEDSRTETAFITRLLTSMGLDVDHTRSAEDAIMQFDSQNNYDLVITDILLEGNKSGLSLISHIRGLSNDKSRIPVLTVTGFDDVARRIELLRAGTSDYIVKPVIKEELAVRVTNLINSKQLMDEVIRQQVQMHEMAITDKLTGCHNRYGFTEITEMYLASARRRKEEVSLLLLDLDFFKQINDTWGHDKGDVVLREVGQALRESCREGDVVSRMGGEEFIVFLSNCSKSAAIAKGQRLRKNIESLHPGDVQVTTSIGVTTIPGNHSIDLKSALVAADKAMYRAKQRGRNCVSYRAGSLLIKQ